MQDAWGSIACTGSNFLIRAAHLAEVGYFPTYTMVRTFLLLHFFLWCDSVYI